MPFLSLTPPSSPYVLPPAKNLENPKKAHKTVKFEPAHFGQYLKIAL